MSVEFKDYYATLGVPRDAKDEAIKSAFRKLARKYHPDVAKDKKSGEAKFKEINEAHEVLSDPQKRKRYDELGANWKEGAAYPPPPGASPRGHAYASNGRQTEGFHFGGTGFSDFFEEVFARSGGSGFSFDEEEGGSGRFTQSRDATPGNDIEGDILVTLDEVLKGAVRDISLQSDPSRSGEAQVRHFKVRIPAGVREGQRIRVAGKGGEGGGAGKSGDLYLRVRLAAHPDFRVRGADLYYDLDLAPWEAVLGTTAKIQTLTGQVGVRIPPGTNGGQQLRVPKHGLPQGKEGGAGNLYVVVAIKISKAITAEEKALWEKLAQISPAASRREE